MKHVFIVNPVSGKADASLYLVPRLIDAAAQVAAAGFGRLLRKPLNTPDGMSELEASRAVSAMAAENRTYATVLRGAGAYDHYIPSIVKYIPAKEEFLTAYTPYQAEMSQGLLQSIFEYQTMIWALAGRDVPNASV